MFCSQINLTEYTIWSAWYSMPDLCLGVLFMFIYLFLSKKLGGRFSKFKMCNLSQLMNNNWNRKTGLLLLLLSRRAFKEKKGIISCKYMIMLQLYLKWLHTYTFKTHKLNLFMLQCFYRLTNSILRPLTLGKQGIESKDRRPCVCTFFDHSTLIFSFKNINGTSKNVSFKGYFQ